MCCVRGRGKPAALNCSLSGTGTRGPGAGGRAEEDVSPPDPLISPRFLDWMLKGGQGSLASPPLSLWV